MKFRIIGSVLVLIVLFLLYAMFSGGGDAGTVSPDPTIQLQ